MSENHSRCSNDLYKTLATHDYLLTQGPSIKRTIQFIYLFLQKLHNVSDCLCNFKWRKELHPMQRCIPCTVDQPPALRETPLQPSEFSSMPNHGGSAQHLQQVGKSHCPPQKIREAAGKNLCGHLSPRPVGCLWLFHEQVKGRRPLLQVQPGTRLCYLISCSAWW